MSVIYNWPDRCPSCGHRAFSVSSREQSKIVLASGWTSHGVELPPNTLRCTCADPTCRHRWSIELATTAPTMFWHPKMKPLAVCAPTPAEAELLVALPDDWRVEPLTDLLGRGAERVAFVQEAAEREMRQAADAGSA